MRKLLLVAARVWYGAAMKMLLMLALAIVFSLQSANAANPRETIVLVHGAFADGSSWSKVIPLLQAKGFNVVAVQNPLYSLADDVAATERAIAKAPGRVLLVGHSWAGMVISVAGNDPKVAGLVYISALIPEKGQTAGNAAQGYPPAPGGTQASADAAGYLSLTHRGVDEDFVPELSPDERAVIYATQIPWNSSEGG
jgi:pimeloyl-ACP methyl ester carboxylesterase